MERPAVRPPGIRHLRLKVGALLLLVPIGILALTLYALKARGLFEPSHRYLLIATSADAVDVGMPVTVSGVPIGTVTHLGLTEAAELWVEISVPAKDAKWLRASSRFTLHRPLVGASRIRVETTRMQDPLLAPGSRRELVSEDATGDIPVVVARVKGILENLERLSGRDSSLDRGLAHLETVTGRMAGDRGLLEGLTGNPGSADKLLKSLDQLHQLTVALNGTAQRLDRLIANADHKVLGRDSVVDEARKTVVQLNARLSELQGSIQKLDASLDNARAATADARAVAASTKEATVDLRALRQQVDDSVAKTDEMLRELNRRWPFKRDARMELP